MTRRSERLAGRAVLGCRRPRRHDLLVVRFAQVARGHTPLDYRASTSVIPFLFYYTSITRATSRPASLSLGSSNRVQGNDMAMELEVLDRKAAADNEVNWVTAIFMGLFHVGAIAALFFFTWKAFCVDVPVVGFGQPGHRHGLPPPAHASRLQDSQVGGVLPDRLRHAGARRRTDFLGGDAPHPSPVFRSGRRSAFAPSTASGGRTWAGF